VINMSPAFDTYLLGYAEGEYVVPKPHEKHTFHGAQGVPTILVNGVGACTWRYEQPVRQKRMTITTFERFSRVVGDLEAAEAQDVGWFYGTKSALVGARERI
jgi:hypothetical protein